MPGRVATLRKVSALILDDNAHMREILKTSLSAFGVGKVFEAGDSASAMGKLISKSADLVFVDLKQGENTGLSGLTFCREVRARAEPRFKFIPLIVVTAYSEFRYLKQAIDAGADEFLVKPVSASALALRINAVIERRRSFVNAPDYFGPDRRRRRSKKFKGPFRRSDDVGDVKI